MAATYSLGIASIAAAAGATYFTLHTGALIRARIREVGLFVNAATASSIGIIRPANTPIGTTSVLGLPNDPADPASTVNLDTAWAVTPPTVGTAYLRKAVIPATIGNGIIWTFQPDALVVNVSSYLVFWNFGAGAGSVLNGYVTWEE